MSGMPGGLPAGVLESRLSATEKRLALRRRLDAGELTVLPGAFSPLVARMIAAHGFAGVYVSGHMIAADLGLPDLGLTTSPEVAARAGGVARAVDLPVLVDADTGFGSSLSLARTIQLFEDAGVAGCHLEDQRDPKQHGGGTGVRVVSPEDAAERIRIAVLARRDPAFVIIARTDSKSVNGLADALHRAELFEQAGADAVFVEGLATLEEVAEARSRIRLPMLVNVDELGASAGLTAPALGALGIELVIHPLALLRIALQPVDDALTALRTSGSLASSTARMHPPAALRTLLATGDYDALAPAPPPAPAASTEP